jgi:hypothetical protein
MFPQLSETNLLPAFMEKNSWIASFENVEEVLTTLSAYKGISKKTKSELIGAMIAEELSQEMNNHIQGFVRSASGDHEPDVIVEDMQSQQFIGVAEIKVAAAKLDIRGNASTTWRGGEFSKRDGDYFLVSWDFANKEETKLKWFVCYAFLKKEDWTKGNTKNYYATTIQEEKVLNQHNPIIIVGGQSKSAKGNSRFTLEEV